MAAQLSFYYSAMNAGKSTILLQTDHKYREHGMKTLLIVPKVDNRFGVGKITSRIGLQKDAVAIDNNINIFLLAEKIKRENQLAAVLVDEAHFLAKSHIVQLGNITILLNIPVVAFGLRSDFQGEIFEGSKYLLAWAENLIEVKTICHCGRKSTMSMRIDSKGKKVSKGAQIEIGGNERYVNVCREHFFKGDSGNANLK